MFVFTPDRARGPVQTLRFTPAEWRVLLEDPSFLTDPDNSYRPRRLMGLPVEIVPDHRTAVSYPRLSEQTRSQHLSKAYPAVGDGDSPGPSRRPMPLAALGGSR